jgi:hypothetical protein
MPPATAADLGIRRDEIHEARKLRDAESAEPGLIRRALPVPPVFPQSKTPPFERGFMLSKSLFCLVEPRGVEPLTS